MSFVKKFFEKKPQDLKCKDLSEFIDKKLEESINLDYKSGSFIENIEKLANHVSAFANTEGGLIILGVSEKKVKINNKTIRIYSTNFDFNLLANGITKILVGKTTKNAIVHVSKNLGMKTSFHPIFKVVSVKVIIVSKNIVIKKASKNREYFLFSFKIDSTIHIF